MAVNTYLSTIKSKINKQTRRIDIKNSFDSYEIIFAKSKIY